MTAQPNRLLQRPDLAPDVRDALDALEPALPASDVLSDVLRTVRLAGSMLFLVDATEPWRSHAPDTRAFAPHVMPRAQHLVSYHIVVQGQCWAGLSGEPLQPLAEGDGLVVPHGDAYVLASHPDAPPSYGDDDAVAFFRGMAAGELPSVVSEGGGGAARTSFICGFLGCDARPFNPILWALPRAIHLRRVTQPGDRLSHLLAYAVAELRGRSPGSRDVLLRLSELMFVEVVRRQLAAAGAPSAPGRPKPTDPPWGDASAASKRASEATGWLAALRDPLISRVLARLHAQPDHAWTLQSLSDGTGASRSKLAERFAQLVGQPPMHYLAGWRMQLATRLLAEHSMKVRAIADSVGYASEAAFSRAFKKHTGMSPQAWRQR
ncbi:MAG: AraC family transcriptional regulator [Burkholderiaceae bacterium]|nr:AraC family transcriptional regulator [Burkholderiaceae bacterium]